MNFQPVRKSTSGSICCRVKTGVPSKSLPLPATLIPGMNYSIQAHDATVDISFEVPSDLEQARSRKATLQDEAEAIEYQLSDKDKTDEQGDRLPPAKYHKWRRQAVKALLSRKVELRFLKRWISDRQQTLTAGKFDVDPNSQRDLLAAASNLLQEKIRENGGFADSEIELANLIRDRVLQV